MKKISFILLSSIIFFNKSSSFDTRSFNYLKNPRVKAFLDVISYAEGTLQPDGYRMRYPNITFESFRDHPREKLCAPFQDYELCATASGRYMILAKTWDKIAPQIGARDFSPTNQDRAALALIMERGALPCILHDDIRKAISLLNPVWATFPGAPYGQPTKKVNELLHVYQQRLALYLK